MPLPRSQPPAPFYISPVFPAFSSSPPPFLDFDFMTTRPSSSILLPALLACLGFLSAGCLHLPVSQEPAPPVVARRVESLVVDARQGDKAWEGASPITLLLYDPAKGMPEKSVQAVHAQPCPVKATVRLLHDEKNLYVGCQVENDDICSLVPQDQLFHFFLGDVMEVFLKPKEGNAYLELYATPSGHKTTYFFPSRSWGGVDFLALQKVLPEMKVAAEVEGTLNDSSDRDSCWRAVMTIPKALVEEKTGVPLAPGRGWQILLAGYSRSSYRTYAVNFSYPLLPALNFHLHEYWGELVLE